MATAPPGALEKPNKRRSAPEPRVSDFVLTEKLAHLSELSTSARRARVKNL